MNIVCAIAAEDATALAPDVLVLPEGLTDLALAEAVAQFPNVAIVAAAPEKSNMRAQLLVRGQNQVDYLKVRGDGRSEGIGKTPKAVPICEWRDCAIGVLICRDIEEIELFRDLLQRLRNSSKSIKLLCIPADMHGDWFNSDHVRGFEGVFIALSNNNGTYPVWRARSFIAKPDGKRIVTQRANEPIVATATRR